MVELIHISIIGLLELNYGSHVDWTSAFPTIRSTTQHYNLRVTAVLGLVVLFVLGGLGSEFAIGYFNGGLPIILQRDGVFHFLYKIVS